MGNNLLKTINIDGIDVSVCDDTARTTANTANSTANTNKTNIANLTTRVTSIEAKSRVTVTYDVSTSKMTITTGTHK